MLFKLQKTSKLFFAIVLVLFFANFCVAYNRYQGREIPNNKFTVGYKEKMIMEKTANFEVGAGLATTGKTSGKLENIFETVFSFLKILFKYTIGFLIFLFWKIRGEI